MWNSILSFKNIQFVANLLLIYFVLFGNNFLNLNTDGKNFPMGYRSKLKTTFLA